MGPVIRAMQEAVAIAARITAVYLLGEACAAVLALDLNGAAAQLLAVCTLAKAMGWEE